MIFDTNAITPAEQFVIRVMKERPVTREELQSWLHVSDRAARAWIADIRRFYPVIASAHTRGYKIATSAADLAEAEEALDTERKKAISIFEGQKALRAFVAAHSSQPYKQLTLNF